VPTVGCLKVTRQTGGIAVRANVDVYRRTVETVEASANDVLLTTAPRSEKRYRKISERSHSLEASDVGVLEGLRGVGPNGEEVTCYHSHNSSTLSYAPSPSRPSGRLYDREGGFILCSRKGWIGWMLCTSLYPKLLHQKARPEGMRICTCSTLDKS